MRVPAVPFRDLATLIPAAIGAAAAVAAPSLPWRIASAALGLLVTAALLVRTSRSRAARVAALERDAKRLLDIGPEHRWDGLPARPDTAAPARVPSTSSTDAAVRRVRDALDRVGSRTSEQVRELAKRSRNLASLINALDEPILATDDRDRVLFSNRAAETLFNSRTGGLTSRVITELITHADLRRLHARARAGVGGRARVRMTTPGAIRVLDASAVPVPAAWGEGVFGVLMVLRDVTELDQAMQVKSNFVANASHELRTPTAAIRGAVETLLDETPEQAGIQRRLLGMIASNAARLEEMIRDLMDLSRLESPDVAVEISSLDPRELVRTAALQYESLMRDRSLTLDYLAQPPLTPDTRVGSDRRLITALLTNLIENAMKFAYEGTTIRVVATLRPAPPVPEQSASPLDHARADDHGLPILRIEVIDEGIGIPLDQQERVFERFYQVDEARSGTTSRRGSGLGLSIVKHAAKALGGRAGIESLWKKGTTAWFEIPVAFLDPDPLSPPAPSLSSPADPAPDSPAAAPLPTRNHQSSAGA